MGSYFNKILFAMLVCFLHTQFGFVSPSHVKCIERERQALLNFKQGLRDDSGMLSTWSNDDNNRDCCEWKGVECSNETGNVLMLELHYMRGALNLTSLIDLQNIEHLDLSNNDFLGSHTPKLIGSFKNLRYLNLLWSEFGGRIPYQLGNLSTLEYLDLSDNYYIYGEIPYQLRNLSQLRYLDLTGYSLSGAIPFQVGNLPCLHTLGLDGNFDLKIKDAKWLSSLSSLTTLELWYLPNLGSSRHWLQIIRELIPNLRELRLGGCSLSDDNI